MVDKAKNNYWQTIWWQNYILVANVKKGSHYAVLTAPQAPISYDMAQGETFENGQVKHTALRTHNIEAIEFACPLQI